MVVENRNTLPAQIRSIERVQFGNRGVSYQQAWRTREALRAELEGDEASSFRKMPGLIDSWKDGDGENWGTVENMNG